MKEKLLCSTSVLAAVLLDLTKMAKVIVTMKAMPDSPDVDMKAMEEKVLIELKTYGVSDSKIEQEPVAFGLIALKIMFVADEEKGSVDPLEENIQKIDGVQSVETVDVRRALG